MYMDMPASMVRTVRWRRRTPCWAAVLRSAARCAPRWCAESGRMRLAV